MNTRLLLICFLLYSCGSSRMMQTSLYFGQSIPDGGMVTEKEWNSFKENYIRKVFKEGSSVINVTGNWYDTSAHQLITEPTYMVIYFYKRSPRISQQIDSLRYWYKTIYHQQSVLRVDSKIKANF